MEAVSKEERRAAYPFVLIFGLLVTGLVTAGCLYFAPIEGRFWKVVIMICVLLFGSGACMGLVWQQQRTQFYQRERNKSRRLATVLRDSNDAITIQDLEGRITAWNHGAELMYGYSEEEAIRMNIGHLTVPDKVEEQKDFSRRLLSGETVTSFETQRLTKDGRVLDVWMTVTKLVDDAENVIGIASTERDTTELKREGKALQETKEYLEKLLNYANVPIIVWNAQSKITRFNPAFEALTGRRADEVIGKSLEILFPPALVTSSMELVKQTIGGGRWEAVEIAILQLDGSTRTLLWNSATVFAVDGKTPAAIIAQGQDVTERKRAEEALKKTAADLERSNKELEQFAAVASHDLQEPLRMISSYTQLLAERYEGQLDDKAKKYIAYAVDGAIRMQTLINDLLAYSRVGGQGQPLEPTDSHSVLGEAIRNLAVLIEEKKAIITNDDLPMVRADAEQFVLLFQNLLANAIKFRGKDPPRVHVSAQDHGREWVFAVKDNGIGIEPQHAERVFVIFQRLHTREEYSGTGIGLAVCKKIIERHGGKIWFESEPGNGTTFFFTLPK
jgi:PAS domain S-box-containing protein